MKKRLVWLLVFLSVLLLCTVALADWQVENGTYMTYLRNGKKVAGTQKIDKVTYYFNNDGHLLYTGRVQIVNGAAYYVGPNNQLTTGWQNVGGAKYYFGDDHKALTGWQFIGSYFYYFEPDATKATLGQATVGARTVDNQLCTFDENGILKGNGRTVTIGGLIYALDPATNMCREGWAVIEGATYHFGPYYRDDGTPVNNGLSAAVGACYFANSKEHFYFGNDGKQLTGLMTVGGAIQYYDPNSAASWGASHNGARYYGGWMPVAGNWYYFKEEGALTGIQSIWDGSNNRYNNYYFDANGIRQTGRVELNSRIYYFSNTSSPVGQMITGWYSPYGTQWYYLTENGAYTGMQTIRDDATNSFSKYYFSDEGYLQYNWVSVGGRLYYCDPAQNGKLVKRWQYIDSNWYFFDETNDYAVTGLQSLTDRTDGKTYDFFFANDGKLQYGLQTYNNRKYFFDGSTGRRVNGWINIDGSDYYFAPYAMTSTTMKLVKNGVESYYQFDAEGRATSSDLSVINFVERCYEKILNRASDAAGLSGWVDQLVSGKLDAAALIDNFMGSDEFVNRALSSDDKVEILYNTMLDRASDPQGKENWESYLDAGCSNKSVINGFSGSEEFAQLCLQYGITPGSVNIEYRDLNKNVTGFVQRCYQEALKRDGEAAGLNYWCQILLSKGQTPRQVASGFIFSDEVKNKGLSLDDTLELLYRLYLGRDSDAPGKAYWKDLVENHGWTIQQVNDGFAGSVEFGKIMESFELK